jgi:hypothetical protein
MTDKTALPLRAVIWTREHFVDVMDSHDNTIVRLHSQDFQAIRQQPHRRLSDYLAPPLVQMEVLTRLFLADAWKQNTEIIVPPIHRSVPYTIQKLNHETHFLVPMGTPVYPIARGTVISCGHYPQIGYSIIVRHAHGLASRYTHLATLGVVPSQHVQADTMMGRAGISGDISQPTLGLAIDHPFIPNDIWTNFGFNPIECTNIIHTLWPEEHNLDVFLR